mmetsp:Transcript_46803/g.120613  ORF Transcript_46803/g.120613 Transcript_46803/m.120613 type:complete len:147 (-) Transcript_46803:55-495(-)
MTSSSTSGCTVSHFLSLSCRIFQSNCFLLSFPLLICSSALSSWPIKVPILMKAATPIALEIAAMKSSRKEKSGLSFSPSICPLSSEQAPWSLVLFLKCLNLYVVYWIPLWIARASSFSVIYFSLPCFYSLSLLQNWKKTKYANPAA